MNLAEVKSLRAEKRYDEAARISRQLLKQNPADIWTLRSHGWSLYYLVKTQVQAGKKGSALAFLEEFDTLKLTKEDLLIHEKINYFRNAIAAGYLEVKALIDKEEFTEALQIQLQQSTPPPPSIAWTIYYILRQQNKLQKPDIALIHTTLTTLLQITKPTFELVDKMMLIQLTRIPISVWNSHALSPYLKHLGLLAALEKDDFDPVDIDGKAIPSLAERIFISYSKALIRENAAKEVIMDFITHTIEGRLEQYAHMHYVPYFKAKLLLKTGDKEQGMKAFLPFARKKQREFWVWQVLAEIHQEQSDIHLSCLCKALTCKTKPEFLSKIKERIIRVLIDQKLFDWAKTELDSLVTLRQKKGWGLHAVHQNLLNAEWYQHSRKINLPDQYQKHVRSAEQILKPKSSESNTYYAVVTQVNDTKQVFSFVTIDQKAGFTSYKGLPPSLGQTLHLSGNFSGPYFHLQSIDPTEKGLKYKDITKHVNAKLTIPKGKNFGFVDGVFVTPTLINQHNYQDGDLISGLAVYTPIRKDGPWKWKLLSMD